MQSRTEINGKSMWISEFKQILFYDCEDPEVMQNVLIEIIDRERNCVSIKHNRGAAGSNKQKLRGRKCCIQVKSKSCRIQGRLRALCKPYA